MLECIETEYPFHFRRFTLHNEFQELKNRLIEVNDIQSAVGLLHWDQSTYMPPGGAAARARQSATLGRLAHEKFTDPEIGHLLDTLQPYTESLDYDSDEAGLIRVTRRQFERAIKIPSVFFCRGNNTYIRVLSGLDRSTSCK